MRRRVRARRPPGRVLFNEVLPPGIGFINETHGQEGARERWWATATASSAPRSRPTCSTSSRTWASSTRPRPASRWASTTCASRREKDEIIERAQQGRGHASTQLPQRRDHRGRALQQGHRHLDARHDRGRAGHVRGPVAGPATGFNPIFMMADSGSRGNREQVRQLAGMRGLMAKPQKKITGGLGEIIESPVIHNFKEGLTVLEYFISTHGARKGLADTALKTADAGYLTRRLVDVAQDVIINEPDCGTDPRSRRSARSRTARKSSSRSRDRVLGRVAAEDVDPPDLERADRRGRPDDRRGRSPQRIDEAAKPGLEKMRIRSVLTCDARRGVCAQVLRPQPRHRASGGPRRGRGRHRRAVDRRAGHAAHAAHLPHRRHGEPHRRAVAHRRPRTPGKIRPLVELETVDAARNGQLVVASGHDGEIELARRADGRVRQRYNVPYGAQLFVADGAGRRGGAGAVRVGHLQQAGRDREGGHGARSWT